MTTITARNGQCSLPAEAFRLVWEDKAPYLWGLEGFDIPVVTP